MDDEVYRERKKATEMDARVIVRVRIKQSMAVCGQAKPSLDGRRTRIAHGMVRPPHPPRATVFSLVCFASFSRARIAPSFRRTCGVKDEKMGVYRARSACARLRARGTRRQGKS